MASINKLAAIGYDNVLREITQGFQRLPVDRRPEKFSREATTDTTGAHPTDFVTSSTQLEAKMQRASLHDGSRRSSAPIGSINLKKRTVRIAGPAAPPGPPKAALPGVPATGSTVAALNVENEPPIPQAMRSASSTLPRVQSMVDLEAEFAELLGASSPARSADLTAASTSAATTEMTTAKSVAMTDDTAKSTDSGMSFPKDVKMEQPASSGSSMVVEAKQTEDLQTSSTSTDSILDKAETHVTRAAAVVDFENKSIEDLEQLFLQKAIGYLLAIPENMSPTVDLIKRAASKLQHIHVAAEYLGPDITQELRARYVNAIVAFINDIHKGHKVVSHEGIWAILTSGDGGFFYLCGMLTQQGYLCLDTIDQIVGLSKAIEGASAPKLASSSPGPGPAAGFKDPLDGAKSWPAQEKRENVSGCRTCILTGLPEEVNINQVQALVWGGRVESIQLSKTVPRKASVKFLTSESCEEYFKGTENGIIFPGTKIIICVEKGAGPNSVNDVVKNCVDGKTTRCVRAYDADDDWKEAALVAFAKGCGQSKREIDCVKQGQTTAGRKWVEFRFANIYNSLNFKRELLEDHDWEHCMTEYASDPCDVAQGVHMD